MNSNAPYLYGCENEYNSLHYSQGIHCSDNFLYNFFFDQLLNEAMSVFEWKLPESWDSRFFLYNLYLKGFLGIYRDALFGVIPSQVALSGVGVFYQPTKASTVNPVTVQKTLTIDEDIVIIKLREDYQPPLRMIGYYANLMAITAQSLGINLINSKVTNIFTASKKSVAESLKRAYDEVSSGRPAVIVDKALVDEGALEKYSISTDLKARELHDELTRIHNEYLSQIGVKNSDTTKKERMVVDEVNSNSDATLLRASLWLESLQKSCKKTKELFDIEISVDWRFKSNVHTVND